MIVSVESVITKHLPGFPQGNPGELRVAASYWTSVAGGLRTLVDDTQGRIDSLSSSWQGGAKTAFEQEWTALASAVQQGCEEMGGVATALHQAADKLENAQHAYEVAVGAAAVTAIVGIAATFITFGASDAADVPVIEAEVAAATEVAAEATAAASTAFSAAVTIAQQIAVRFVVYLGVDLTAQAAISTVVFPDHNPFGHLNLDSAISVALGMAAAPELPGASGLVKVAVGGAAGAGSDALSQLITTGKVDPGEVLFNGALGAAGAAVMVGAGNIAALRSVGNLDDPRLMPGTDEYNAYIDELSLDPAHGGMPRPASEQEAIVAVQAEADGKIPGPLTRTPLNPDGSDQSDFTDATGQHWEVKSSPDIVPGYSTKAGMPIDPPQSTAKFTGMINFELTKGNNVLLDPIGMSPERLTQIQKIVDSHPAWQGRVVWGS